MVTITEAANGRLYNEHDEPVQTVVAVQSDGSEISGSGASGYTEGDTDATLAVTVMGFEADTGTNTVRAVSQTYPAPVQQAALAPTVDAVTVRMGTSAMSDGLTALTPKFAAIAAVSSGDNTLVAAVALKKLRVVSLAIVCTSAVSLYFQSAAAGDVIFGGSTNTMDFAANGGMVLPFNPVGWFETDAGELLNLNLSGAIKVSGGLTYVEV